MLGRLRSLMLLSLGITLAACGAKSGLQVDPPLADSGVIDTGIVDTDVDTGRPDTGGPDTGPPIDVCIELPYRDPPSELEISFVARIQSADVFFLVDVTGSMSGEIGEIQSSLVDEIVPGLVSSIPDVRLGVGYFADFPLPELNYGNDGDEVFRLLREMSPNVDSVNAGVGMLPLQGGLDFPESMVEALYQTATGAGLGRFVRAASCPAGTVGYPCFRDEGSPIILLFTDAPSHNGTNPEHDYFGITPRPHTYIESVNALREIGAKVLGLYSGDLEDSRSRADLEAIARDTGAVRMDGSPIVFSIGRDGAILADSVIEAVRTLVDDVPIDVDVLVEDLPGDTLDATQFVTAVIADRARPPGGATIAGDRFLDVRPGTRTTFRILLANERIPQTDVPQIFLLRVVLRGDGVLRLRETVVQIVVPSRGGGTVCLP